VAKDELVVALERRPATVLPKRVGERLSERDRTDAVLALRVTHAEHVLDQRHVTPAKRLQLRTAKPGQHQGQERGASLLIGERLVDAGDFGRLEDRGPERRQLRPLRPFGRVRLGELLPARSREIACRTERSRPTVAAPRDFDCSATYAAMCLGRIAAKGIGPNASISRSRTEGIAAPSTTSTAAASRLRRTTSPRSRRT
jgi:hypothetical protein